MSRIRSNTLALTTSFFTTAFFSFIQIKILTNAMDQSAVGMWSTVVSVGALFATCSELGLPWVMVRYGAKFDAEGRLPRLYLLWKFAIRIYAVALIGVVGVLLVAGPALARILGGEQVDRWTLILGYLAVASGSLRAFNNASFRGLRRMRIIAIIEILFAVSVTAGLLLLRARLTVVVALAVGLAAGLVWAGVGLVVLVGQLRRLSTVASTQVLREPIYPEIKGYWQGASVSNVFLVAIEQLDKPILAAVAAFEKVAVFHVAGRLALFARRLIYVPFQVMNPEITHKWESGRRQELTADMELFTKLAMGLGLGMVVFLGVFATPLLLLTSTSQFLSGAPVLWVFIGVLPFLCLYQPLVMFLRATGRVWYAFVGDAGWLITYLGTAVLLVEPFGLPGYVSGQIVASVLVFMWVLAAFHRLRLPRPPLRFYLTRVALGIGVWLVSVAAGRFLPVWPWWGYVAVAAAMAVVGNFLAVRGGYLTPHEEERTVALLIGRGTAGRIGRFLFAWPHGIGRS